MRDFGYFEEGHERSVRDIRLWHRILLYCADHKLGLGCAITLSLIVTCATLGLPRLMQLGIDTYVIAENIPAQDRIDGLAEIALWYGVLVLTIFLTSFVQIVLLEWIGQTIMHQLRQNLFHHLLDLDLHFFHSQPAGRLVTRLTNDIQNMHEMFTSVMVTLFNDFLKLIGIFFVLYFMNVKLAIVMSVFIPLALISTLLFARLARDRFRAIRSQLAKLNSFLSESLGNITVIQTFNSQAASKNQYYALTQEYLQRTLSQIRLFGTFMPITEFMSSAAIALILWYGGGEVIRDQLTLGELVAFFSYMRLFFQPLRELSQKYSIVQSAMASAERIFQLLDEKPSIRSVETPVSPIKVDGSVDFRGIRFGYDSQVPVLHNIDLTIRAGETVALVGSTGSGKTTLISLLARFYDPDEGGVYIDNVNIHQYRQQHLRQVVGLIMQDIFILPDTVRANIVLDLEYDERKLHTILNQTGIQPFINKLPKGLDTLVGEGGLNLSVGEKQLLSFVRALYREPAILVLDEATASIDTESENLLEKAVTAGFENRTSIVIAHRLSTIRRADRIVVMDQGRIIEQGTHTELMAKDNLYRQLVEFDLYGNGKEAPGPKLK